MATTSDAHAPLLPHNAEATTIVVREPEAEGEASETTPANESWGGTASIKSASFNMTNTMLGAGIMALPYAMKTMVSPFHISWWQNVCIGCEGRGPLLSP